MSRIRTNETLVRLLNLFFSIYIFGGSLSLLSMVSSRGESQLPFLTWTFLGLVLSIYFTALASTGIKDERHLVKTKIPLRSMCCAMLGMATATIFMELSSAPPRFWKVGTGLLLISSVLLLRANYILNERLSSYISELIIKSISAIRSGAEREPRTFLKTLSTKLKEVMGFPVVQIVEGVPVKSNKPIITMWEGHIVYYLPFTCKQFQSHKNPQENTNGETGKDESKHNSEEKIISVIFLDYPGALPTVPKTHMIHELHQKLQHTISTYEMAEEKEELEEILFQESLLASHSHMLKNVISGIIEAINTGDKEIIREATEEGMSTISSIKGMLEALKNPQKKEKIDLAEFVESITPKTARESLKTIQPKPIVFSSEALRMVLNDLIKNSLRASVKYGEKPTITIEGTELKIKNRANEKDFENIQRAISGKFVRSQKGFGMGLAMIFRILKKYNAKYEVNFKNGYVEITIKFPLWQEKSIPGKRKSPEPPFEQDISKKISV